LRSGHNPWLRRDPVLGKSTVYANDLPNAISYNKSILFADDTTVYKTSNNIHTLYESLNKDLECLTEWFKANKLSLNVKKTNYMLFSLHKEVHNNTLLLKLEGKIIERKSSVKFLGIIIDEKVTWGEHIAKVRKKLSSSLFAIRRAKHALTPKHLKILYYSLFYPHIDYGIILWGSASKKLTNQIWILQKKAIRTISGQTYNTPTNPLFSKLRILKFIDIYKFHLATFMHKLYNAALPIPLNRNLVVSHQIHQHFTRNINNPRRPKPRINITTRSIYYSSYTLWYDIDTKFKDIAVHAVFARKFRVSLLNEYSKQE